MSETTNGADLAEKYLADRVYNPGTVLQIGGTAEVTLASADSNTVIGIVSSEPGYLMNGQLNDPNAVAIALVGRVPCRVIGPIRKGDFLISAGFGFAKASSTITTGQLVGRALEDFPLAAKGVIQVKVMSS
jgi:hypothetical protein